MKTQRWGLMCCGFFVLLHAVTTCYAIDKLPTDSTFQYYDGNDILLKSQMLQKNANPSFPGKKTAGIFVPQLPSGMMPQTAPPCARKPICPDISGKITFTNFGQSAQIDNPYATPSTDCPPICQVSRLVKMNGTAIEDVQYPVCPNDYIPISSFNPDYDIAKNPTAISVPAPIPNFDTMDELKAKGYTCTLETAFIPNGFYTCITISNFATTPLGSYPGRINATNNTLDVIIPGNKGLGVGQFDAAGGADIYPASSNCSGSSFIGTCSTSSFTENPTGTGAYNRTFTCYIYIPFITKVDANFYQTYKYYKCDLPAGYQKQDNRVMTSVLCAHPTPAWFKGKQMLNVDGTDDNDGNPFTYGSYGK